MSLRVTLNPVTAFSCRTVKLINPVTQLLGRLPVKPVTLCSTIAARLFMVLHVGGKVLTVAQQKVTFLTLSSRRLCIDDQSVGRPPDSFQFFKVSRCRDVRPDQLSGRTSVLAGCGLLAL